MRAKDKSGNSMIMVIYPKDSVSEVITNRSVSGAPGLFVNAPSNEKLSSNLIGMNVYDNNDQDIRKIKDLVPTFADA